jgi:hypothetical protein
MRDVSEDFFCSWFQRHQSIIMEQSRSHHGGQKTERERDTGRGQRCHSPKDPSQWLLPPARPHLLKFLEPPTVVPPAREPAYFLRGRVGLGALDSGCLTCKASVPVLEQHLQIIVVLFILEMGERVSPTICPGGPQTLILLTSASQVARVTKYEPLAPNGTKHFFFFNTWACGVISYSSLVVENKCSLGRALSAIHSTA